MTANDPECTPGSESTAVSKRKVTFHPLRVVVPVESYKGLPLWLRPVTRIRTVSVSEIVPVGSTFQFGVVLRLNISEIHFLYKADNKLPCAPSSPGESPLIVPQLLSRTSPLGSPVRSVSPPPRRHVDRERSIDYPATRLCAAHCTPLGHLHPTAIPTSTNPSPPSAASIADADGGAPSDSSLSSLPLPTPRHEQDDDDAQGDDVLQDDIDAQGDDVMQDDIDAQGDGDAKMSATDVAPHALTVAGVSTPCGHRDTTLPHPHQTTLQHQHCMHASMHQHHATMCQHPSMHHLRGVSSPFSPIAACPSPGDDGDDDSNDCDGDDGGGDGRGGGGTRSISSAMGTATTATTTTPYGHVGFTTTAHSTSSSHPPSPHPLSHAPVPHDALQRDASQLAPQHAPQPVTRASQRDHVSICARLRASNGQPGRYILLARVYADAPVVRMNVQLDTSIEFLLVAGSRGCAARFVGVARTATQGFHLQPPKTKASASCGGVCHAVGRKIRCAHARRVHAGHMRVRSEDAGHAQAGLGHAVHNRGLREDAGHQQHDQHQQHQQHQQPQQHQQHQQPQQHQQHQQHDQHGQRGRRTGHANARLEHRQHRQHARHEGSDDRADESDHTHLRDSATTGEKRAGARVHAGTVARKGECELHTNEVGDVCKCDPPSHTHHTHHGHCALLPHAPHAPHAPHHSWKGGRHEVVHADNMHEAVHAGAMCRDNEGGLIFSGNQLESKLESDSGGDSAVESNNVVSKHSMRNVSSSNMPSTFFQCNRFDGDVVHTPLRAKPFVRHVPSSPSFPSPSHAVAVASPTMSATPSADRMYDTNTDGDMNLSDTCTFTQQNFDNSTMSDSSPTLATWRHVDGNPSVTVKGKDEMNDLLPKAFALGNQTKVDFSPCVQSNEVPSASMSHLQQDAHGDADTNVNNVNADQADIDIDNDGADNDDDHMDDDNEHEHDDDDDDTVDGHHPDSYPPSPALSTNRIVTPATTKPNRTISTTSDSRSNALAPCRCCRCRRHLRARDLSLTPSAARAAARAARATEAAGQRDRAILGSAPRKRSRPVGDVAVASFGSAPRDRSSKRK